MMGLGVRRKNIYRRDDVMTIYENAMRFRGFTGGLIILLGRPDLANDTFAFQIAKEWV